MGAEVRYCTTEDGVRIAYTMQGEGPPLLFCGGGFISLSVQHLFPDDKPFMDRMGRGRQLIRYDMRGSGLSQRDVDDFSHDALVRDIEAVGRAATAERCSVWASSLSGPRAIDFAARNPDKVHRLILYGTFARPADVWSPEVAEGMVALATANWQVAAQTLADFSGYGRRELPGQGLRVAEAMRRSTSAETVARLFRQGYSTDVSHLLPQLKVKTLVLHRIESDFIPFEEAQKLAARIPDCRLVPLSGTIHDFTLGDSKAILDAVDAFLAGDEGLAAYPAPTEEAAAPTAFRTILFTDMVGHTEMMRRLGDAKGREVLREHERITREVLKEHGGTEVKTMGDGFMASFSSVTGATECAIALQRAFAARNEGAVEPIVIRVGLNAGEPIQEEGDYFGATVILAARIAAQAGGGEILASVAVRELCAGKGFLFADRGETVLRGFEDPVRLYEVRWRE